MALDLPLSRVLTEVAQSVLVAEPTRLTVVGVGGVASNAAKDIVDAA
jgi:hypothetical protein